MSGDTRRLLLVRGLNAQGQALSSGEAMWVGNFLSSVVYVSIDINGRVAAAEIALAERFGPLVYSFCRANADRRLNGITAGVQRQASQAGTDALADGIAFRINVRASSAPCQSPSFAPSWSTSQDVSEPGS